MGSYISYSKGDVVGECIFQYEVPLYNKCRCAVFECRKCDSHNHFTAKIVEVRRRQTKSCGCFHKIKLNEVNSSHGLSKHPLYGRWINIKARCYNEKHGSFPYYGGRGILLSDEWKNDFKKFYTHMMGLPHAMENGYSIDRIDNDDGYRDGNVRWATSSVQQRNKRYKLPLSGHKGVYYIKHTGKWEARVWISGMYRTIGCKFATVSHALQAQKDFFTSPVAR